MKEAKVERAAVSEVKRQLVVKRAKLGNLETIETCDTAFHLDIRRNVLTFFVGEVLIDGEMIVDASKACIALASLISASTA
jgi:hypothetical protein